MTPSAELPLKPIERIAVEATLATVAALNARADELRRQAATLEDEALARARALGEALDAGAISALGPINELAFELEGETLKIWTREALEG